MEETNKQLRSYSLTLNFEVSIECNVMAASKHDAYKIAEQMVFEDDGSTIRQNIAEKARAEWDCTHIMIGPVYEDENPNKPKGVMFIPYCEFD